MAKHKSWTSASSQQIYTAKEKIGEGGNGAVFYVTDNNNQPWALKELKVDVRAKAYKRFRDEIEILSKLTNHKGIIQLIDSQLPDKPDKNNVPFYVMPLGETLEQHVKGKSHEIVFSLFQSLSDTLIRLHEMDITHRDIKPANMLVIASELVFSDFGLANFPAKEKISSEDEIIGAKWTVAPEMQRPEPDSSVDFKKADVYSFAKSLWMVLTGRQKAFEGQYIPDSPIGLKNFVDLQVNTTTLVGQWYYFSLVLLEQLLIASTSNDPAERPTMAQFKERLEFWMISNDDFFQRNGYEWQDALSKIFPVSVPLRAEWNESQAIFKVLRILTTYDNLNHMFYPDSGGMDMDTIALPDKEGFFIINDDLYIRPKRLIYEQVDNTEWGYFRIELAEFSPQEPRKVIRKGFYRLEGGSLIAEDHFDRDEQYGKYISQFDSGTFVITLKTSPINNITGSYNAYSAWHNDFDAVGYRQKLGEIKRLFESGKISRRH